MFSKFTYCNMYTSKFLECYKKTQSLEKCNKYNIYFINCMNKN